MAIKVSEEDKVELLRIDSMPGRAVHKLLKGRVMALLKMRGFDERG